MNMNKACWKPIRLLLCCLLLGLLLPGCESRAEKEKREYAEMVERNYRHVPINKDDMTPERAAAIAHRLLREQADPVYEKALLLFAQQRYLEAADVCRTAQDTGNSMILYLLGRSLAFHDSYVAHERRHEDQVIAAYLQACGLDNPYAMTFLSRRSSAMTVHHPERGQTGVEHPYSATTWGKRALKYWLLRKEADDPDALYCLGGEDDMDERQADIIRSAWLGHEAALLDVMESSELRKWGGVRPEIPGWQEVVLEKLKKLADAGNPLAQYNYGLYVKDYSYLEKAADNGLAEASNWLSMYYRSKPIKELFLLGLFYALQRDVNMKYESSYEKYRKRYVFKQADHTLDYLTYEEYQEQLDKVLEWHKAHPYRYRYVHPLEILD